VLGYVSLASLTIGVGCACLLAAEHGSVVDYGGYLSVFGFLSACVYACAIMGIVSIRRRDFDSHRKWMFRYAGSMWGAFWLFRVMLFVLGPVLRNYNTASLLICIWFSTTSLEVFGWIVDRIKTLPVLLSSRSVPSSTRRGWDSRM
jgi:hypothetical protein